MTKQWRAHAAAANHGNLHQRFRAEVSSSRKRGEAARPTGRQRADVIPEAQRGVQVAAAQPGGEKAGVECVAGAGRIHNAGARRGGTQVDAAADDAAARRTELDHDEARGAAPAIERVGQLGASGVEQRLVTIQEQIVDRRRKCAELWIADERRIPAEVPRTRDATAAKRADQRDPGAARLWEERQVYVTRARQITNARQLVVDAVEGQEPPIAARRQRDGDRRWLVAPRTLRTNAFVAEPLCRFRTERADDGAAEAEPRRGNRGDDRAAARRPREGLGLELFAAARQAIERVEDQIVERLASGDQIEHERKVS